MSGLTLVIASSESSDYGSVVMGSGADSALNGTSPAIPEQDSSSPVPLPQWTKAFTTSVYQAPLVFMQSVVSSTFLPTLSQGYPAKGIVP